MNGIIWSTRAVKQLLKLQPKMQVRIRDAVGTLVDFPAVHADIKALKNHASEYRLRVGQFRVLFNHAAQLQIISIEEVKKRDDRTY